MKKSIGKQLKAALAASPPPPPHLIVEARAGTGKTTTLIEGLKLLRGETPSIRPSPQQQAVWDQMVLSRDAKSVCFVAFNVSIADELKRRVPAGVDAMTMNSMGNRAVTKAFGRQNPTKWANKNRLAQLLDVDGRVLDRTRPGLVSAVCELVDLCKQNLVDPTQDAEEVNGDPLGQLISHYDVQIEPKDFGEVCQLVPEVMEMSRDPKGEISFADQIWLPVVLGLPLYRYDLLLVDEAQDLNRCQQALAKKTGRRLILVGDPKQAIYGFAGADSESMIRMRDELSTHCFNDKGEPYIVGCMVLPLTVTRRCGKAIVTEANKIVPDFEAYETNCEGAIGTARYQDDNLTGPMEKGKSWRWYGGDVQDGDMVLCRVNAPLVSQCFKFIKVGRKATIRGRDVASGLTSTVKKMGAGSVTDLVTKLSDWHNKESAKESAKRNPSENRLIAIRDRFDCLLCFIDGAKTVDEVLRKINQTFGSYVCPRCKIRYDSDGTCFDFKCDKAVLVKEEGITLSSIHKAKGLEAKRVFFLTPKGAECPHPMAKSKWQVEQEWNLKYVAITRAIEELVYVY